MTDRSLLLFQEGIDSKESLKTYLFGLERFRNYYKLKSGDVLLTIQPKKLQEMIEDYVMQLKKEVSPNSVSTYMKGVEHFFVMNDVTINWKKIHKLYPSRVKKGGGKAYTNQDIQNMLVGLENGSKVKALIHLLASTGCRIGAVPDLKIKHVKDLTEGCKVVTFYPDSDSEYVGFLTPEASRALDEYIDKRKKDGEYFSNETPLFRSKYVIGSLKAKPSSVGSLKNLTRNLVNKSVEREKIGERQIRNDKAMNHAFRKRFNTILKNNPLCNRSLTEKLMSHEIKSIPLDSTYHDPDLETLFKEFKIHIPNLIIDDSERLRLENKKLEDEKSKLTIQRGEFEDLKKQVTQFDEVKKALGLLQKMDELKKSKQPFTKELEEIESEIKKLNLDF